MDNKIDVGIRIKNIRLSKGLNLREFGEEIAKITKENNISDSIVSRWEKGISIPNPNRIKAIAEYGNTSVKELLYGDFLKKLENIANDQIKYIINDNDLDMDMEIEHKLKYSVTGLILSFYDRGEENFNSNLFVRLLRHYLQLELDLGDRDLDSLTYFAFQRTTNAQELVVDYYEDSKAKKFLEDENIDEFLTTISNKYSDLLKYIDDYREKHNLERISEEWLYERT